MSCKVLEGLHESNAVTVWQIIQVLEEALLLGVSLVVITVLLDTLARHVLAVGRRTIGSSVDKFLRV